MTTSLAPPTYAFSAAVDGLPQEDPCVRQARVGTVSFCDAAAFESELTEFHDATYEQTDCYMSGRWGAERTHRVLVKDAAHEVIGGAVVVEFRLPIVNAGLSYVKFGPFWRRSNGPENIENYRAIVKALMDEFAVSRGHMLTILPRPSVGFQSAEKSVMGDLGFEQTRELDDADRYLVAILDNEESQKASLAQKWRYNLKKSLKNDIRVSHHRDETALRDFSGLHAQMISRKQFNGSDPLDITRDMMARLPDRLAPHIFLAWRNDELVAGAVVGVLGDTAYYVYGASADAGLPLKAGYTLHWEILKWLQTTGVSWYDLGGRVAEPGLHQFKKGMVGKAGTIVEMVGEMDYAVSTLGRWSGRALFAAQKLKKLVRR